MQRRFYANILKLNYLIMRFTSIPENGASWREKLIYAIDTESAQGVDLRIEIVDTTLGQLASLNVYNVTSTEVDIAPYLRASVDESPTDGIEGLTWSSAALSVVVRVGEIESPKRLYYRAKIDSLKPSILSNVPARSAVSLGDTLRMTIYAPNLVEVKVVFTSMAPINRDYTLKTDGRPVEFTLPLINISTYKRLTITVRCDGRQQASYAYVIAPRDGSSRQLVWYNVDGGIESYTFPKSVRVGYLAEVSERGDGTSCVSSRLVTRRLYSAYEPTDEMERIMQMVFSPSVYLVTDSGYLPQHDIKRRIEFSPQGSLSQLKIDVVEEWKGGRL